MRNPNSRLHGERGDASVAMTPMIDVVFLLLIFFLCAAAGTVRESVIATDLSAAGNIETEVPVEPEVSTQIQVVLKLARDPEGRLAVDLNGTPYLDLDQLEAQLRGIAGIDATNPIVLDIGAGVDWGSVIDLYDRCRRSGLESVGFATGTP
jgi:biopolymer transport protein ExbD